MPWHLALQLPGRIFYFEPVFCRFGKMVQCSPNTIGLWPSIVLSKLGSNYSNLFASRLRSGRDHPSSSLTWARGYRSSDALESENPAASIPLWFRSLQLLDPWFNYTGEVSAQITCDMLACIGNSCYATLSCKVSVNLSSSSGASILVSRSRVRFQKIGFDMSRGTWTADGGYGANRWSWYKGYRGRGAVQALSSMKEVRRFGKQLNNEYKDNIWSCVHCWKSNGLKWRLIISFTYAHTDHNTGKRTFLAYYPDF